VALLGLLVMVTDSCCSVKCGDPAWIDRAMWLGVWAGGAVGLADLARRKVAFLVPIIGCAAQVGRAIGAAAMEWMAGPLS
jgi:hypothetical protein